MTLLKEQLFTSVVTMVLFPLNEGWLFVKEMVSGVLKFQVSILNETIITILKEITLLTHSHDQT